MKQAMNRCRLEKPFERLLLLCSGHHWHNRLTSCSVPCCLAVGLIRFLT